MVKALLFDLDGTLWDRDAAVRATVIAQHGAFPELAAIPVEQYVARVRALDAHGLGDKNQAYA
ncbi:MAG: hypothetical protein FJW23_09940 [Acidimicrobiia bacterium]|nr:hypothetical protein [Acidimicrobiia bacterium]